MDRHTPSLIRNLAVFREQVEAGRADETLKLDPRSRGNKTSASSLVEEVIHIVLGRDNSHRILQELIHSG